MFSFLEITRKEREHRPLHALTYRLAARKVLHERSISSLIHILIFSYIGALTSQFPHLKFGLYKGLFTFYTFTLTGAFLIFGSILVGLRNARVQVNPRMSPNILFDLQSIASDLLSVVLVSFYVILVSTLHALILVPSSEGLKNYSELVVYINEKGISQINERYILTRTFSFILGVAYGMYHLLNQRDRLSFSDVQLSTVPYIYNGYWKSVVKKSLRFAAWFTVAFWFSYNILLSRFLVNTAMRFVVEDILYHAPQYGPRWYSIPLATRLFFTSFSIVVFMESVQLLCDHLLSKRMNVTATSVDPSACMVSGLKVDGSSTTPESLLTYHAFQELAYLAGHAPVRRAEIFAEATSVPSSWKQISGHCMELLNKAASRVDRASLSAPPAVTAAATSPPTLNATFRRRLPPGQGGAFEANIFRPSKHDHFFDSLKGLSTEEILAQNRIDADKSLIDANSGKRPYLGGSRDRLELVAFRWISKTLTELGSKVPMLQQLSENPNPEIFRATEDFQLTVWSFQSLARLVVASYKEDQYGVVQKDISRIMESMLGLLMSLEYFLVTEGRPDKLGEKSYAQRLLNGRSLALAQALKTSIYQIVITFRAQLGELVLAPKYAARLQHFVEFDD